MKIQDNDAFYEFIKRYDPDDEHHLVGEVLYYLLRGDKPYEGVSSHREALRFVFDLLVKDSIEDKEKARMTFGDELRISCSLWSVTLIKQSLRRWIRRCFFTARIS